MAGGNKRTQSDQPSAGRSTDGALWASLPDSGEICVLRLGPDGRVAYASAGCSRLFRREAATLVGMNSAALLDGFAVPEGVRGNCDALVSRDGRPGFARIFWARDTEGVTLLLADLERLSRRGLSKAAASAHFVAEAVHEVRNPLTPLKLILQTLPRTTDPVRMARYLTIALQNANAIERIVDALAGLLARPRPSKPLVLRPVIEKSLQNARLELEQRGVALLVRAPAAPCSVRGDEERLGLALKQLVGTLAHGRESGEVVVEVAESAETVELHLSAAPPAESPPSGLVLPMALASKVCSEHGGALQRQGDGFVLTLPALASEAVVPGEQEPVDRSTFPLSD